MNNLFKIKKTTEKIVFFIIIYLQQKSLPFLQLEWMTDLEIGFQKKPRILHRRQNKPEIGTILPHTEHRNHCDTEHLKMCHRIIKYKTD